MIDATVTYARDWISDDQDSQTGHIRVQTSTGVIEATWSHTDGSGGANLVSNTTKEFTDYQAHDLINSTDLCQGDGSYRAYLELAHGPCGDYAIVRNVEWIGELTDA